jgi:hypothetical protein
MIRRSDTDLNMRPVRLEQFLRAAKATLFEQAHLRGLAPHLTIKQLTGHHAPFPFAIGCASGMNKPDFQV